ncbi:MAG: gamma-glutamyltransferase family protein [Solirubrobacteraceae bacterium]
MGKGVVAAGHPLTAEAGADALREGGNAVDAAIAAMLASCVAEPMLTGLGAGGYMLVSPPGGSDPVLLDFFVEAPGRGADPGALGELEPIEVSFGDANQVFNIGPASVGAYGTIAGADEAARRFGSMPLSRLAAPAARMAREGVRVNAQQAYVLHILDPIARSTPEAAAVFAPGGRLLREGETLRDPALADALERLGEEGAAPFYAGEVAAAVVSWVGERGGALTLEDLRAYEVAARDPVKALYSGREVLLNPPPSAGGILIAYALSRLEDSAGPPTPCRLVEVMEAAQAQRTPDFLRGLAEEGFLERFLAQAARRAGLGSTTHISVLDEDGWACGVTCSNGSCSGVVVPGTGLHLNNMMGEQDLNPLGFHGHEPGRRMPSMMAPTVVLRDGRAELVLGSGGSNRIRSAILQTIVNVLDRGMDAPAAVQAPRLHFEDGIVYVEPGIDTAGIEDGGYQVASFSAPNLFFGGVHAVERIPATGTLSGGGDPRRGGAIAVA